MNPEVGYETVKVGTISPEKLKKALLGQMIRLTNADLSGDRVMVVNKLNAKAIKDAKRKQKGLRTFFTPYEALNDMKLHDESGGSLAGGSLWSWLRDKALPWVRKNANILKPVASALLDTAVPAAATFLGAPASSPLVRKAISDLAGVGATGTGKGSAAMKEKMAALRARRKIAGGSWRMP